MSFLSQVWKQQSVATGRLSHDTG
jgi:hypothetical protein